MTPIILSADDYALNAEVDKAIVDLIGRGLLTAASCLVLSPRWPQAAKLLGADIRSRADIGLHLDFTEFAQPARHRLPALITRAMTRTLPHRQLRDSIEVQLDRFEQGMGDAPDYIDGHQHVHQLPQIREALFAALGRRYGGNAPWIRLANPPGKTPKETMIRLLGARKLAAKARKAGLPCSGRLLGVYGFDLDEQAYSRRLSQWLGQAVRLAPQTCALMCHPATSARQAEDPIGQARVREYEVLAREMEELLSRFGLRPVRGTGMAQSPIVDA